MGRNYLLLYIALSSKLRYLLINILSLSLSHVCAWYKRYVSLVSCFATYLHYQVEVRFRFQSRISKLRLFRGCRMEDKISFLNFPNPSCSAAPILARPIY
uniref:Putative secreted protein n=1 Tax=Anopheles triannulatus TaxID=58253 RepID=A0A2M4B3A6_9DIPT